MARRNRLKVTDLDGPTGEVQGAVARQPVLPAYQAWADLNLPAAGSKEEDRIFQELYRKIPDLWRSLSGDGHIPQTVVVVPSMTLDVEELQKLKGAQHYEERLLFMLILLSLPKTRVIFVTSEPIHPFIIDYYLQLLPGIPFSHARSRLEMFAVYDTSPKSLTQKILERPSLLRRIRKAIGSAENSHLTVFNVTQLEKSLSVARANWLLWQASIFCFVDTKGEISTKNPGSNPIMAMVSIHQMAGATGIGAERVRKPREAQYHDAASTSAEAARWSGW